MPKKRTTGRPVPVSDSHISDELRTEAVDSMYIVTVGASAGGLDALEKLFAGLPSDSGAAYVVIQHLSPDHKSMMSSLLSRHTAMPVIPAEDGMRVEQNRVYLIPPGFVMHLQGQSLRLTPKGTRSLVLPIDVFLHSLAKEHGERSIAVILSGTGSDGTRGAVAINEAGGFLLVQDPEDAKFDGMPRSAISTGLVDAILPVEALPARILAHLQVPQGERLEVKPLLEENRLSMQPDAALSAILHLLQQLCGINFEDYKPGTVLRRIERRMAVRQVHTIQAYLELLDQDRAEAQTLSHELLIPVTSFFRDSEAYAALQNLVVAPLVASRETGQSIRVWCAGVATGEEPYSIAMLFLEAFEQAKRWPSLKIFATDVEQANIDTASTGSYPESIVAEISPERLERFFQPRGNRFVVKSELRQCVVFARHNLLNDPPFTKMDLVVCRNTLIYFRPHAQDKVLRRLQYALQPKGRLFLGSSESLGDLQDDFQTLSARNKLWQLERPGGLLLGLERPSGRTNLPSIPPIRQASGQRLRRLGSSAVEQGYNALLKVFGPPPAVLVNSAQELIHAYGDVSLYLQIREGQISLEITRILKEPLVPVAAALLFKAARENSSVSSDAVRLNVPNQDDARLFVRLTAVPAGELDGQRHTLLIFERLNLSEQSSTPRMSMDIATETTERIEALEHELAASRESLQATIEELETSNEELQATNEEMMASNEELQSSNEELQSVNEELNTVNAEYQEKIEILNRINADLDHLTKVVATSTIFVDDELTLVRFSPEAASIFRLRDSDLGRPLSDMNHQLSYPTLLQDIRGALVSGQMIEKGVAALDGRHFMVRMLPYSINSSGARGVVLGFMEVSSMHEIMLRMQDVMDALGENIAVLDQKGQVVMVNDGWTHFACSQFKPEALHNPIGPGADYLELCMAAGQLGNPYAQNAYDGVRAVLADERETFVQVYPCDGPEGKRWYVMRVRRLQGAGPGAAVSHIDITEWYGKDRSLANAKPA